jgi:hypothetical protein
LTRCGFARIAPDTQLNPRCYEWLQKGMLHIAICSKNHHRLPSNLSPGMVEVDGAVVLTRGKWLDRMREGWRINSERMGVAVTFSSR